MAQYMQVVRYRGSPVLAPLIRLDHSIGQIRARAMCAGLEEQPDRGNVWDMRTVIEVNPALVFWEAKDRKDASVSDQAANARSVQAMDVAFDSPLMAGTLRDLLAVMHGNVARYRERFGDIDPAAELEAMSFDTLFYEGVRFCYLDIIAGRAFVPWAESLFAPKDDRARVLDDDAFGQIIAEWDAAGPDDDLRRISPLYQWATLLQSIPALERHA